MNGTLFTAIAGVASFLVVVAMVGCDTYRSTQRAVKLEERVAELERDRRDRVADLERAQLVNRRFGRNVSRAEGNAVGMFIEDTIEVQKSGFLVSGVRFGRNSIAFDFTRGQETLTKIVSFYEPLP